MQTEGLICPENVLKKFFEGLRYFWNWMENQENM